MSSPARAENVVVQDGAASIVVDERAWPIVIATWFGEPTTALVEKYFAHHRSVLDRARAAEARIVLVTDTFATERASATVRQRIVDLSRALGPDALRLILQSYVIIESTIMRGVVTALSWVYPDIGTSETVGSLAVALERAVEKLRAEGITPPAIDPARATRPERPPAP